VEVKDNWKGNKSKDIQFQHKNSPTLCIWEIRS